MSRAQKKNQQKNHKPYHEVSATTSQATFAIMEFQESWTDDDAGNRGTVLRSHFEFSA